MFRIKLPGCFLVISIIVVIAVSLYLPVQDYQCSKSKNICYIYSRNVISSKSEIIRKFNMSDILQYKIVSRSRSNRHSVNNKTHNSYSIYVYLKSGEVINLRNDTPSYDEIQQVYNTITKSNEFTIKGKHLLNIF